MTDCTINLSSNTISWKKEYIDLFGLDMSVEEILKLVGKTNSDILKARVEDEEFDRECEVALKQYKTYLLQKIGDIERQLLRGGVAAYAASSAQAVIKSMQWRLNYISEYEEATRVVRVGVSEPYVVELISQVDVV